MHRAVIHRFTESLERSIELSDECNWAAFYRSVWPNLVEIHRITGKCADQLAGIDRVIYLPNGKVTVDEKIRSTDYDDIALETWSVVRSGKKERLGWAVDPKKQCDFIAYAIPSRRKCYLMPREILRLTVRRFGSEWREIAAQNDGYVTLSRVVGWAMLSDCMKQTMDREWCGKALDVAPEQSQLQIEFNWMANT